MEAAAAAAVLAITNVRWVVGLTCAGWDWVCGLVRRKYVAVGRVYRIFCEVYLVGSILTVGWSRRIHLTAADVPGLSFALSL